MKINANQIPFENMPSLMKLVSTAARNKSRFSSSESDELLIFCFNFDWPVRRCKHMCFECYLSFSYFDSSVGLTFEISMNEESELFSDMNRNSV